MKTIPKSAVLVVAVSLLTLFSLLIPTLSAQLVGGVKPVEDVKGNKRIQALGRFSVEEFNLRHRGNNVYGDLKFLEVVDAQPQVVAGLKYYLKIQAVTKSGETKLFDSVVWVQDWLHQKQLLGFGLDFNSN